MIKHIKVYTTPTCPYCENVKKFLQDKKISFQEIDISHDPKAAEEVVADSGQMGVPVVLIENDKGENRTIVGYDEEALEDAIKNHE